jgi:CO/xanthine dehydrogenase FAD-binding subunit
MYFQPKSFQDALRLKSELGGAATPLAGGTDLVVGQRKGHARIENYLDISRVAELRELSERDGFLSIGALVNHARLETCEFSALAAAAATVGGPQIRQLGTIGGQLGTASPAGDVSVALLALQAEVELASIRGRRRIALEDFFLAPGKSALEDDELISTIYVPLGRKSDFYKIGKRNAVAISLLMVAISTDGASDISIAIGCAAPTPLRMKRSEALLGKAGVNETSIVEAAKLAAEDVSPISDHRGSADYRRAMSTVLVQRLLSRMMKRGEL